MIDLRKPVDYDQYVTVEAWSKVDFDAECNRLSALGFVRAGELVFGGGGYTFYQQWVLKSKKPKISAKHP